MATGGPRSFTSTPLRLRDGHCVSESGDTLLLVHRTSSRSGRCSRTARTGGRATVTCAVGWRCVGSEHRVPGFGRAGVHAKLNLSPGHTSIHHIHHTPNTLNTLNTPHTPYTSLSTCAVSHTAVIQQHTAAIQQLTAHTSQQSIHHQYIAHITRNITKSRAPYITTFELVGRHSKKSTATGTPSARQFALF